MSGFKSLVFLDLSHNRISKFDETFKVGNLTNLQGLFLNNNTLSTCALLLLPVCWVCL